MALRGSVRLAGGGWRCGLAVATAVALLGVSLAPSPARAAETRYSIAGGCFNLTSAANGQLAPGGATLRFQASDLGSYLLFRRAKDFLAAGAGDTVGPAAQPSPAADWVVEDAPSSGFTLSPKSAPTKV